MTEERFRAEERRIYDGCNRVLAAIIAALGDECDQWRSRALSAEAALAEEQGK